MTTALTQSDRIDHWFQLAEGETVSTGYWKKADRLDEPEEMVPASTPLAIGVLAIMLLVLVVTGL
jgi:hypothetical protein